MTNETKHPEFHSPWKAAKARPKGLHAPTPGFEAIRHSGMHGRVILGPRQGHDPGSGAYVEQHPTHYRWRPDVRSRIEGYVNNEAYKGRVWANTYKWHPPYDPPVINQRYDAVSADFWDWGGRGHPINDKIQESLFWLIFNDPRPPNINWIISGGWMWSRVGGWQKWDLQPDDGSDFGHWFHIHVTYL